MPEGRKGICLKCKDNMRKEESAKKKGQCPKTALIFKKHRNGPSSNELGLHFCVSGKPLVSFGRKADG